MYPYEGVFALDNFVFFNIVVILSMHDYASINVKIDNTNCLNLISISLQLGKILYINHNIIFALPLAFFLYLFPLAFAHVLCLFSNF